MSLDCQTCGICCTSLGADVETIADMVPEDVLRLNARQIRLHVLNMATRAKWQDQTAGPLAGARACVCNALSGSILHRVRCTIYEVRPQVCREFAPGSKRCLEARAAALRVVEDFAEGPA